MVRNLAMLVDNMPASSIAGAGEASLREGRYMIGGELFR